MDHHPNKSDVCLNCGYHFTDENSFCPRCGQENHSLHVPFKHLVLEFIEGTLHVDTKILKTFTSLLFKPGFLTKEFNSGKRINYLPPVRIYIFVSFVFFFLINFASGHIIGSGSEGTKKKGDEKRRVTFQISQINSSELKGLKEEQLDSLLKARNPGYSKGTRYLNAQLLKIANGGGREFIHSLVKNFSYSLFILMPLFGWLLYLFHNKKKYYYFEFLIFSLHFHCFIFLLTSFIILLSFIYFNMLFIQLLIAVTLIYLSAALQNAFPQRLLPSVIKAISLSALYGFTVTVLLLAVVLISIYYF